MKTFLSTLILSAGISLSATADTSLLESSIVGYSDFASCTVDFASCTADFGTQKDNVTIATDGDFLKLSGTTFSSLQTDSRDLITVTMVLDLAKINTPAEYTPLFKASDGSTNWGVGLTADRKLKGLWGAGAYANGPTTDVLGSTGLLTVSMVTDDSGTCIYYGEKTATASGLFFSSANLDRILVDSSLAGAVDQLYVHNTNLSEEQVSKLMTEIANVPEPATATLGLLGLAALMTRRRRA